MKFMTFRNASVRRSSFSANLVVMTLAVALLSGCGGTKVYDTTKTIVYKDNIYQVTNVQTISSSITGVLDDQSTVNMKNMDKKQVEALIDANDSLFVSMKFDFDAQDMVYVAQDVDNWRDYSRMESSFSSANKKIAKLMSEKKTKQLKLP